MAEGGKGLDQASKKIIKQHLIIKKPKCGRVNDVLVDLGGVYSFHPVLDNHIVAEHMYEHYRSKLIAMSTDDNGFVYYSDEISSEDKYHQLICTITKTKRTKLARGRMVLRAVIKIIVPGPPKVGFVRVYELPCKSSILFCKYIAVVGILKIILNVFVHLIGRRSPHMKDDIEQATQVASAAVQCLQMNVDWVYETVYKRKQPCVLNCRTGKLEDYIPEGTFNIFTFVLFKCSI